MSQGAIHIDVIVIAATLALFCQHARRFEMPDDALYCTLGNADVLGNVPQSSGRILCQANQHVGVVAEECPGMLRVVVFQYLGSAESLTKWRSGLTLGILPTILT